VKILTDIKEIEFAQWEQLLANSPTATWFQSPAAYRFFASQPNLFSAFVVAIPSRAYCVGYITHSSSPLKQWFTRRAIVLGGPALAADCSDKEVYVLLATLQSYLASRAIYLELRNFNSYTTWQHAFVKAGFSYEPHNNFHVSTALFATPTDEPTDVVAGTMSNMRVRNIKASLRDGVQIIDQPSLPQVKEYYTILRRLYRRKVKKPLFPFSFFEQLYAHPDAHFLLVGLPSNGTIKIIGGTICVAQEGRCLYEWFVSGMDGRWPSIYPSSVATYAAIRYAADHSLPRFDMMGAGIPNKHYGVRDFKAEFGGDLVEHGRYKHIFHTLLYRMGVIGVHFLSWL